MQVRDFAEWRSQMRRGPGDTRLSRHHRPRHRPRDPESERALTRLAVETRRRYIACGKLKVTPEGYEFEPGRELLVRWLQTQAHD